MFSHLEEESILNSDEGGFINFLHRTKLEFGFALYIIGSIPELGNWIIQKAIRLECFNEHIWIKRIYIKKCQDIEFKFFISTFELDLIYLCWIEADIGPFENHCLFSREIKNHIFPKTSQNLNSKPNILKTSKRQKNINKIIKIMSFNILYDTNKRGENLKWENRKDRVLRLIKETAPDIIGVQEVLPNQEKDIKNSFGNIYNYYGLGRNSDHTGEQSGILVNKYKFDIQNSGTFWLSGTPDVPGSNTFKGYFPRVATWARLRYIEDFYFWDPDITNANDENFQVCTKSNVNEIKKDNTKLIDNKENTDINVNYFRVNQGEKQIYYENFINKKGQNISRNSLIKNKLNEKFFFENRHNFTKKEFIIVNTHYDHISEYARKNSTLVILTFIEEKLKKIFNDYNQNFKNFKSLKNINKSEHELVEVSENQIKSDIEKDKLRMELINDFQENKYKYFEKVNVIVFITGDFNSDDNAREIKYFKKNLFYSLSKLTKNDENTFHDYTGDAFSKIDHIFFRIFTIDENFSMEKMSLFPKEDSPDFNRTPKKKKENSDEIVSRNLYNEGGINYINYEVIKQKIEGMYPSDHFPILGCFEFD